MTLFSDRSFLIRLGLTNLPFVLAITVVDLLPSLLVTLVTGAVMFLAPGAAWTNASRDDTPTVVFWIVVKSLLVSLACWLVLLPLPGPTSRIGFVLLVAAFANAGLFVGHRRGWYGSHHLQEPLTQSVLVVGALFFLLCYAGATKYVPALEDQDMETQGTAYGLIHHAIPSMATNRGTWHFFAHPLLLHFWIGESALISDDLERLRYYHELATERSIPDGNRSDSTYARWEESYERFLSDPVLLPSRLPNLFLGVFLLFPLAFFVFRLSGSRIAAAGACVIYATLPEVYVRNSYGGYLAVTNWLITSGAYFFLGATGRFQDSGKSPPSGTITRSPLIGAIAAAVLCGWADQKAVLFPMASGAFAALRKLAESGIKISRDLLRRPDVVVAALVGTAFVAGWACFAIYGIAVSKPDFIQDHLKGHLVDRLNLSNVNFVGTEEGNWVYPSVLALWMQFLDHTGWFYAVVLAGALARFATRLDKADGIVFSWFTVGAIGFSLVDWRQTKHLAHILPAIVILVTVYWASLRGRVRHLVSAVLVTGFAWNIWRIAQLMRDFNYLQPLPIW